MKDNYLTVSALTKYIKRKIDRDSHLQNIWLKGEISNFNHHSRGHMYLTIKDDQSRVQSIMFSGNNRHLKFTPENGMNVLIRGDIGVFEPFGQYQLYIQQMEPDGIGSLYLAYEQLKEKLKKAGLFDDTYKQEIPVYPKHIGIITSPTGAAVRDIMTTIKRRYPIVDLTVIPALVQGSSAAGSIKNAIEIANEHHHYDLLIVGRGGGSIEDLWGFNEEIVAQAIFQSDIPIISAVGHETDHTISDFVADLRAPTPTAAAEMAVPSKLELLEKNMNMKDSMTRSLRARIENEQKHLIRLKQSYAFRYPKNLLQQKEQELDKHTERLERGLSHLTTNKQKTYDHAYARFIAQHPRKQIEQAAKQLTDLIKQQQKDMSHILKQQTERLVTKIDHLTLLNPLEVMKRGFAIPYTADGHMIQSRKQVTAKDEILVKLSDGELTCHVLNVEESENNDEKT